MRILELLQKKETSILTNCCTVFIKKHNANEKKELTFVYLLRVFMNYNKN